MKGDEIKANPTIIKLLGIKPSNYNFETILNKGGILPKYQEEFLSEFTKMLSDIKFLTLGRIALKTKPSDALKYTDTIFPTGKDLDICSIYLPVLLRLRSSRRITPEEYLKFKNELMLQCDNRDKAVNKDKKD